MSINPADKLKPINAEIITTDSFRQAAKLIKEKPFAMIVCDVGEFDDYNAEWLTTKLRKLDRLPFIIFIMSSGPDSQLKLFKIGAQFCFRKNEEGFDLLTEFVELWLQINAQYQKMWD